MSATNLTNQHPSEIRVRVRVRGARSLEVANQGLNC